MASSGEQASTAAEQLEEYERLQDPAHGLKPTRGYWSVMLGSAALIAAYVAVVLSTVGGATGAQVAARPDGYAGTWAMLTPILIFSSLINGTHERFNVRTKPSPLHWAFYVLSMAGFIALVALSIGGITYPWWLNILVPLILFIAMSVTPVRGLIATPSHLAEPWTSAPLDAPSRVVTVLIGITIAALLITSAHTFAATIGAFVVMLFFVVALLSWRSRFGLPRTGYEWGPLHWVSFGMCAAIVFVSVTLSIYTLWFTAPYSIGAGVLAFLIMGTAALLPHRAQRREL